MPDCLCMYIFPQGEFVAFIRLLKGDCKQNKEQWEKKKKRERETKKTDS